MKKVLLAVLAVAWAVLALGCVGDGGKSATEKEFQRLYKEYSARFHEKMVGTAETMKPVQITAEAARLWDETFAGKDDLIGRRVTEILNQLDEAKPYNEDLYLEIASGSRVEPSADQPKGIILKQFLWSPVGAAQMGLNNWLARLLQAKSFGVRSVLTANAGLFWEVLDRNLDKPKLQLRQGPMVFAVELSRADDYYQVEKVRWLRPKSMGPVQLAQPPETPGTTTPTMPGTTPPETPGTTPPVTPGTTTPATPPAPTPEIPAPAPPEKTAPTTPEKPKG
ncbi:MAG TPA: hypothetical protein VM238_00950 [Phycisphaerae bacterium]|nr:hypothetical protein [Phycisphaerae bacterium]